LVSLVEPYFYLIETGGELFGASLEGAEGLPVPGGGCTTDTGLTDLSQVVETRDDRQLPGPFLEFIELLLEVSDAALEGLVRLAELLVLGPNPLYFVAINGIGQERPGREDGKQGKADQACSKQTQPPAADSELSKASSRVRDKDDGVMLQAHPLLI
jgi:hypothetical protein